METYSYLIPVLNWFLSCTTTTISFLPFQVSSGTRSRCKCTTSQIPRFSFLLRNIVLPAHESSLSREYGISLLIMLFLLACFTRNILEIVSKLVYLWMLTGVGIMAVTTSSRLCPVQHTVQATKAVIQFMVPCMRSSQNNDNSYPGPVIPRNDCCYLDFYEVQ